MAHPMSLFDVLDAADSLSQGTFLPVLVFVVAGIVIAFGGVAHERKRARTVRRSRRARADVEQENRIDAGRGALHLDERDAVDRLIADVFQETAEQQMLRRGACPSVREMPEEGGRD